MSVSVSDTVLIQSRDRGWLPAIVVDVYPVEKDELYPDISVVVFVTGFHTPCYEERRVKHRTSSKKRKIKRSGEDPIYITKKESRQKPDEETSALQKEKARLLEELTKLVDQEQDEDPSEG